METKPYRIQSPEDIAKDYGGNKQKIAQAMQMGVVDPTAGVLAGMFIDRMRSAQMQEQAPQQTVAQQVMSAPAPAAPMGAPPAGLGATPEAAMMPPQGGMAPPMAPPQGAPMPPQPPMGMAEGGLYEAPYMSGGGLSELPLPDTMFDESRDGAYAGGGIVAFNPGGEVTESEDIEVTAPTGRYGFGPTFGANINLVERYAPQKDTYGKKLTGFYEDIMSEGAQKKRKKEDLWASLAELGFGIASSKSPTLLGAVGEAGAKAAPAMAERGKERRAEQRDAIKTLAAQEDMSNKQVMESFRLAGEMQKAYGGFMDAEAQRKLQRELNDADNATQLLAQKISAGAQLGAARINSSGYLSAENLKNQRINMQVSGAVAKEVDTALAGRAGTTKQPSLSGMTYQQAQKKNPELAAKFRRGLISAGVNDYLTGFGGTGVEDLGSM